MPAAEEPVTADQPARCDLRNLTPHPLRVEFIGGAAPRAFSIAPLARRSLFFETAAEEAEARRRLRALHELEIVRLDEAAEATDDAAFIGFAFWAIVLGLIAGTAWLPGMLPEFSAGRWLGVPGRLWLGAGAPALLLSLLLLAYLMARGKLAPWLGRALLEARQTLTLALVVAIATALPAATLALFARGDLGSEGLAAGAALLSTGGAPGLGRGIVFAFVCVAAALPGLLYFLPESVTITPCEEFRGPR